MFEPYRGYSLAVLNWRYCVWGVKGYASYIMYIVSQRSKGPKMSVTFFCTNFYVHGLGVNEVHLQWKCLCISLCSQNIIMLWNFFENYVILERGAWSLTHKTEWSINTEGFFMAGLDVCSHFVSLLASHSSPWTPQIWKFSCGCDLPYIHFGWISKKFP